MSKVTFDGDRQLIIVNTGITFLDFRKDVYSAWKEWVLQGDNSKYPLAIEVIGGDPLPEDSLGLTFFLLENWKIRPYEGDHRLTIKGNVYKKDQSDPIADTVGDFKVTVQMRVSNLIDMVNTGGGTCTGGGGTSEVTLDPEIIDSLSGQDEWTMTAS
jgi:hypothetical protein